MMLVSCRLKISLVAPKYSWSSTSHGCEVVAYGEQAVKRQPLQTVQLLDRVAAVAAVPGLTIGWSSPAGAEGEQTQGTVFFVFDREETTIR